MLKKILLGVAAIVLLGLLGGGAFVWSKVAAYDESIAKVYDIPLTDVTLSEDPAVLERGKHIVESIGGCQGCHGDNFGGGKSEPLGPLGTLVYPNVTAGKGGRLAEYSNAELVRLFKHGVKRNGKTALMMPSNEFSWWPMEDVVAVISYLRTLPPVDGQPGVIEVSAMAKFIDRIDGIPLDVARRINHTVVETPPAPAPTKEYGAFLARGCGCHGATFGGGPIPGTPPDFPVPLNLTPHETGLKEYSFADFEKVLREGVRKNGQKLNPFMPVATTKNMNDTEMHALWEFIHALPPVKFGSR